MNSNNDSPKSEHNESHNLCNPHPSEIYKYSYRDMLECWHSARENLVRWGVEDGTDKPCFSTWIKEFHRKKNDTILGKPYYSLKSHEAFDGQCANSNPLVILNNLDDVPSESDKKLAVFWMTGSVKTHNTHSYVTVPELVSETFKDLDEETDFSKCLNCDERAYDGRICHQCGAKDIGE